MLVALMHGISFSTAPILSFGPFKIFVLSTAVELGWRRTLILALTPLVADIPVILAIWMILSQLPVSFINVLKIAGGVFYVYLAVGLIRKTQKPLGNPDVRETSRSFLKAVVAVWITPNIYLNWSIVGVPALLSYANESIATALAFLLGFYVFWIAGLSLQIILAGKAGRLNARAPRALVYLGSALLISFGLFQIRDGLVGIF